MTDPIKNKAQNSNDQLFWREVRESFHMVSADASRDIEIERGHLHAHINVRTDSKKNPPLKFVAVHIWEIEPPRPTLVVPTGATK